MILGVSGDIGSFSEEAALKYIEQSNHSFELKYLIDIEGVLSSLSENSIQYGIFPVVNLRGGLVKTAFEAMGKYHFKYKENIKKRVKKYRANTKKVNFQVMINPELKKQIKKYCFDNGCTYEQMLIEKLHLLKYKILNKR